MTPTAETVISVTTAQQWTALVLSILSLTGAVLGSLRKLFAMHAQLERNSRDVHALTVAIEQLSRRTDAELMEQSAAIDSLASDFRDALAALHPEHVPPPRRRRFRRKAE